MNTIESQTPIGDASVDRFLILCLQGRRDPAARDAARAMVARQTWTWEDFLHAVQSEALGPLLRQALKGEPFVPPPVRQELDKCYYQVLAQNLLLERELEALLRGLHEAGVSTTLLKGAALIHTVYADIALRPMADLDLLVQRRDLAAALRVLEHAGYTPVHIEPRPGATFAYESEIALAKSGAIETVVELHWSLFDSPYYQHKIPMKWFWQTAIATEVGGAPALTLGPEAQLLHLCGHLVLHHAGRELLWLWDIVEVVHHFRAQLDWTTLLTRAQAYDLVLPIRQTLPRLASEWGAPIPASVLEQLSVLEPSEREVHVFNQLHTETRPVGQRFWSDLTHLPSWRQRLRFAWHHLFPSPTYMRHRYRVPRLLLVPLYYPYRWFRGLRSLF